MVISTKHFNPKDSDMTTSIAATPRHWHRRNLRVQDARRLARTTFCLCLYAVSCTAVTLNLAKLIMSY